MNFLPASVPAYTVVLPEPWPDFPERTAYPDFFPVHERGGTAAEGYISNGPFVLDGQEKGKVSLLKNSLYYDASSVEPERLAFYFYDNSRRLIDDFRSGKLQYAGALPVYAAEA